MKKVCFFMATPFSLGGEQRVVTVISNLLVEDGYDVTIACTDISIPRSVNPYNLDNRVKIKYINGYNNKYVTKIRDLRWKLYYNNLYNARYKNDLFMQKFINCDLITQILLIRFFNKGKYDYVISLSTIYNTMLAGVSKKIKAKTIGWQHNQSKIYFSTEGKRHYNQDKFTKYMFKKLDSYVVLTEYDKKYLKEKYNVDVICINNPKSIVSNKVTNLKNKQFLSVGRFDKIKNHLTLIDMFNEFHKQNKEWKLVILGDGELKEEYIKKIKSYNLEKFIIIENYTNDVEKYYLNSSICVMPSLYEGYSMVMTEAMEYGLPIICFDMPCAHEMIENNKSGYIVKCYDEKEFTNKMITLANNNELLKEFSINTKNISNKKTYKSVVDKWIELFKNLKN